MQGMSPFNPVYDPNQNSSRAITVNQHYFQKWFMASSMACDLDIPISASILSSSWRRKALCFRDSTLT
jgi:hypothetical protein